MNSSPLIHEKLENRIKELEKENSELRRLRDMLEKRVAVLTQPFMEEDDIAFEDLFNIDDIQRIQDEFANATGVASIITRTDGAPITSPSNFCRLCKDIIRKTEKFRQIYRAPRENQAFFLIFFLAILHHPDYFGFFKKYKPDSIFKFIDS